MHPLDEKYSFKRQYDEADEDDEDDEGHDGGNGPSRHRLEWDNDI